MLRTIELYFLLFLVYSILGWSMEVVLKLVESKRFINRGFFIGPYCPIYGFGGLLITFSLKKYTDDPIALFFLGMMICSILEYVTSWAMETIFHARWWDYSNLKMNINGRICLETMVPFGLLGMLIIYVLNPFFLNLFGLINESQLNIISITLAMLFIIDIIISTTVLSTVRNDNKLIDKDSTEEMSAKVRKAISERGWAQKRLMEAFPNVRYMSDVIKKKVDEAKEGVNKAKSKVEEKQNIIREQTEQKLSMLKSEYEYKVASLKKKANEKIKRIDKNPKL